MTCVLRLTFLSFALSFALACGGGDLGGGGIDAAHSDASSDTGAPDSADTSAPDTSAPDTNVADTNVADTNVADTNVADAGGSTGCGSAPGANDRAISISHDGMTRSFFVHYPPTYNPAVSTAVVLNFHGRMSSASQQIALSRMNAVADAEGFLAVHPEGVGATWNGGLCCGSAMSRGIDDVGFTRALLDALASEYCVDERRVYATGLSNGGFMSHRLACDLSDRITAIAAVAGTNGDLSCSPSRPVPVLHIHGDADSVVPYAGFAGQLSVDSTIDGWRTRNGCGGSSSTVYERGDVTCVEWSCREGAAVQRCRVRGGGHQWPGGVPIPFLGTTTEDISASDAAWAFFQRFSL